MRTVPEAGARWEGRACLKGVLGVTPEDGFGKARSKGEDPAVIFGLFGKRRDRKAPVNALLARIAEASRAPALYLAGGVADDFEGRFESFTLHVFLVLRRLRALPAPAGELAQELVDAGFAYLELGFRQAGISDVAVPKKLKKIGRSFYGRIKAYEEALAGEGDGSLIAAIARNVGPAVDAPALAHYVEASISRLDGFDIDGILTADPLFPQFSGET